ncbi:hypothetical protein ACIQYZ_13485 [Rhodococcus erythropolis]
MRFEYLTYLFQVVDMEGRGRVWAIRVDDTAAPLDIFLDRAGEAGWELVSFTIESQSHHERLMYVGYQNSTPSSARAIFKRRVE